MRTLIVCVSVVAASASFAGGLETDEAPHNHADALSDTVYKPLSYPDIMRKIGESSGDFLPQPVERPTVWILNTDSFLNEDLLREAVIKCRWLADSLRHEHDAAIVSRLIRDNHTPALVDAMYRVYAVIDPVVIPDESVLGRTGDTRRALETRLIKDKFHEQVLMALTDYLPDDRLKEVYENPLQMPDARRAAFFAIVDTAYVRKAVIDASNREAPAASYNIEASFLAAQGLLDDASRVISQDVAVEIARDGVNQPVRIAAVLALSDEDKLNAISQLPHKICSPSAYRAYQDGSLVYGSVFMHCGNRDVRDVVEQRLRSLLLQ